MQSTQVDLSAMFGVQPAALSFEEYVPKIVPGRVLQIDADFLAYQCSYEREGEEKSQADVVRNVHTAVETYMTALGAEQAILHVTPAVSTKGGRHDAAMLKEYQGNRAERQAPRWLPFTRTYLGTFEGRVGDTQRTARGMSWVDREADDGIAFYSQGTYLNSVIVSSDKDLRMLPGLHCDPMKSLSLFEVTPLGTFDLVHKERSKKLVGNGLWWFIAQMLLGDRADNVQGLPEVHGGWALVAGGGEYEERAGVRSKRVGDVATFHILTEIKRRWGNGGPHPLAQVAQLYALHDQACRSRTKPEPGFVNYRTGEELDYKDALISEARLLWMRRDPAAHPDDWRTCIEMFKKERNTQ